MSPKVKKKVEEKAPRKKADPTTQVLNKKPKFGWNKEYAIGRNHGDIKRET